MLLSLSLSPKSSTSLFFKHNTALGPPYQILLDTNFLNFSIVNKLDLFKSMLDCMLAKCVPIITDCVMAELEKLGVKYRVALRIAKDPRIQRLACTHTGTYADDCLVNRVTNHKCYIVATCDKDLKRRIRKVSSPHTRARHIAHTTALPALHPFSLCVYARFWMGEHTHERARTSADRGSNPQGARTELRFLLPPQQPASAAASAAGGRGERQWR